MSSSSTSDAGTVEVTMPQMGVSVAEGTVVEWRKQPGDWVEAEETICEVSTDKIDTEIPAPVAGRVVELLVEVDETVGVGTVLARIATDAMPDEMHAAEGAAARRYSPVVQRIAAEHEIDLDSVRGTGRGGRVRKQDVLAVVERAAGNGAGARPDAGAADPPPLHTESPYRPEAGEREPEGETLSRMRRSIGAHMKRSLETAATCTTWMEADMSRVEAARAELGLTALPFVARSAIAALREHPQLNAWLEGERYTRHDGVDLGIAVSLGDEGLIVPVIRRAHELSVEGLAARIRDAAVRARAGELTPDDVRGATFTITNPGRYGAIMATPVINQPQVAILDLEAVVKRPVAIEDDRGRDAVAIRPMTVLGLSWDHRALDGALAARFLGTVRRHVEGWTGA